MSSILFLFVEDVLANHKRVILEFGGDLGLRDRGLLESAVAMPRSMFSGSYIHSGLAEMAGAYHFQLCSNHVFIDGNKRVAVAASELFLLINDHELCAPDENLIELTLDLAMGKVSKELVVEFYKKNVQAV